MNNPLFRPPAEAYSLILQIDRGCPYNRCTFCGMYRGLEYQRLPMPEVRKLIADEAQHNPAARRIFLADGDVMRRPFDELLEIMQMLNKAFPRLARVSTYAGGSSIAAKSAEQLSQLKELKLHTLYMGLESGSERILKDCRKGVSAATMAEAAIMAQACGLRMSVMILLGLGGTDLSREHADATIELLNLMQPRLLSALRVVPVPDTELHNDVSTGHFQQLSEYGVVEELHRIIAGLQMNSTVFRANHGSNVIPLEGRLPRDKQRLLSELESLIKSGNLDRNSPGRLPLYL
jgi:radical SAM superfamily enzyme YgiQ (UPF0313 family)